MTEIITQQPDLGINANEFDALVGYFTNRGFQDIPARDISGQFIEQAKIDNVPVFVLIDTLKKLNPIELNDITTQLINSKRGKSSTIGFNIRQPGDNFDIRNIESFYATNDAFVEMTVSVDTPGVQIIEDSGEDDVTYIRPGYVKPKYVK